MEFLRQLDDLEAAFAAEVEAEPCVQTVKMLGDPLRIARVEGIGRDRYLYD